MKLSVIVVHYKAHEYLKRCLRSVRAAAAGLDCETIVVDNASGGLDALRLEFPEAVWLENEKNVGFGAAANSGAKRASGDVFVFLNPDAELLPDSLRELSGFFTSREEQRLGPVGGRLMFSDGARQPSCGPFPDLASLLWRRLLPATRRKYYLKPPEAGAAVDWVTGAFMALKRPVFEELGGFDDDFFLYYEDVDLCLRAKRKGYASYHWPRSAGYHHAPHASRGRRDPAVENAIRDSRVLYFKKHRPAWEADAVARLSGVRPA